MDSKFKITPEELEHLLTWITDFMCDDDDTFKTFGQLLEIFESCKDTWAEHDESNDLKIASYIEDMTNKKWRDKEIVLELNCHTGRVLVEEGIHRGVAYLACVKNGSSRKDLPPLYICY